MWLHSYGDKDGGNFGGVCHGVDQAVSEIIKIVLIPELSCIFWVFKKDNFKTPECVLTCHGNLSSNKLQQNI